MFDPRSRAVALRERRAAAFAQMQSLVAAAHDATRDLTDAEGAEFAALEGEIGTIDSRLAQCAAIERAAASAVVIVPGMIAGRGFGGARNVREALAESGLLARALAAGGGRAELALSIRTLLGSGSDPVTVPPTGLAPISGYTATYNRLIALIPAVEVSGASLLYNRIEYDGSSPNGAAIQTEGSQKANVALKSVPDTEAVLTHAGYEKVSTQLLADEPRVAAVIESILRESVLDEIDVHAYDVLTTGGNFTSFSPTASENVYEAALRVATALAVRGSKAIAVAINPGDALTAKLAKASSSGNYLDSKALLAENGVRVVESSSVVAGKVLGFDTAGRGPQYGDRMGIEVRLGLDGEDFTKNLITMRCEARGVVVVRDPTMVLFGNATTA